MDEKFYDLLEKLYIEVQTVKSELKSEIQEIKDAMVTKSELKSEIQGLKDTMATKSELQMVKDELKTEIQSVHKEVQELRNDLNTMEIIAAKNTYDIAKLKISK